MEKTNLEDLGTEVVIEATEVVEVEEIVAEVIEADETETLEEAADEIVADEEATE